MATLVKKQRDYRFEFVRTVAILFVVANHCLDVYSSLNTGFRDFIIHFINTITHSANALYFIISGYFALRKPVEDAKYGEFYFKKMVYLVLPLFVYMVIYAAGSQWKTGTIDGFGDKVFSGIVGNFASGTHFWFMYVLVGNIFFSPFLARAIDGMSKKAAYILVGMGLVYNTFLTYTPFFTSAPFAWGYPFAQWSAYFVLGGCINKIITTDRERNWFIGIGVVGFVITMLKIYFCSYTMYMYDLAPSYAFYSLMLFLVLLKVDVVNDKVKDAIRFFGKRSYGIYLIHLIIIVLARKYVEGEHGFWFYIAYVMFVYTASLLLSYLFELLFLNHIQRFCEFVRAKILKDKN